MHTGMNELFAGVTGGHGTDSNDRFEFISGHGNDTITGFVDGKDRIDLSSFTEIGDFNDLDFWSTSEGVVIDLTAFGGGTILLEGLSSDDLDADDFLFASHDGTQHGTEEDDEFLGTGGQDQYDGLGGDDHVRGAENDDALVGGQDQDHR